MAALLRCRSSPSAPSCRTRSVRSRDGQPEVRPRLPRGLRPTPPRIKALKRSLKPGNKVTLAKPLSFGGIACQRFTVEIARVRGRKGKSTVFRAENGMLCGISADVP